MKIAMGSDHGGIHLKEHLKSYLLDKGFEVEDYGTYTEASVDYPDYAAAVAEAVAAKKQECGILICGTGIGISIAANKYKGIRCALCADTLSAKMTRLHNDANILALGGGFVGPNLAIDITDTFLDTPISDEEKHKRRIAAIELK